MEIREQLGVVDGADLQKRKRKCGVFADFLLVSLFSGARENAARVMRA